MNPIHLLSLCLSVTSVVAQDRFAAALDFPKRTENKVFRDQVHTNSSTDPVFVLRTNCQSLLHRPLW
jgi:hypothetical protein